jgi:hypothetical protein
MNDKHEVTPMTVVEFDEWLRGRGPPDGTARIRQALVHREQLVAENKRREDRIHRLSRGNADGSQLPADGPRYGGLNDAENG